jgi:E3 ubiquitin-protein ligase UBR1
MLRGLFCDQDFFLMQAALALSNDPDTILIIIIDRFQHSWWCSGTADRGEYHALKQTCEPLPILIQSIRCEIIHASAADSCTNTDLIKQVTERMMDDVCFALVMRDVANFKLPEASNDFGMYELKGAAYNEVNSVFYCYTRNKREGVELVLKTHLRKATKENDPVIIPKPMCVAVSRMDLSHRFPRFTNPKRCCVSYIQQLTT